MKQSELDALPEVGGLGQREVVRNGKKFIVPVMEGGGAMFLHPEDGAVIDARGARWMVGWIDGKRCKQRIP